MTLPPLRRRTELGLFRASVVAPVAQLDRALPSGGRGRRFESGRAYWSKKRPCKVLQPRRASFVGPHLLNCIPFASGNEHKKMQIELLAGLHDAEHGRWISLLVALSEDLSIPPATGSGNVLIG